jgi:hypothetical protein
MQHDRAALIVAHDVERVLTDIDADYGDCGIEFLRHGVLLVFGAPGQLKTLAGQEHGRTIPLDGVIGRPAFRSLEILGAALQADGETRSAFAASSIRRRSAAWTILPD